MVLLITFDIFEIKKNTLILIKRNSWYWYLNRMNNFNILLNVNIVIENDLKKFCNRIDLHYEGGSFNFIFKSQICSQLLEARF